MKIHGANKSVKFVEAQEAKTVTFYRKTEDKNFLKHYVVHIVEINFR